MLEYIKYKTKSGGGVENSSKDKILFQEIDFLPK